MDQTAKLKQKITRRWFIEQCGVGMGALALNHLLASAGYAATQDANNPLAPKKPHFAPKAKNVIFLFMAGAPSHLELFDDKPALRNEVHVLQEALRRAVSSGWNKDSSAELLLAAIAAERSSGPQDRPDPRPEAKHTAA